MEWAVEKGCFSEQIMSHYIIERISHPPMKLQEKSFHKLQKKACGVVQGQHKTVSCLKEKKLSALPFPCIRNEQGSLKGAAYRMYSEF